MNKLTFVLAPIMTFVLLCMPLTSDAVAQTETADAPAVVKNEGKAKKGKGKKGQRAAERQKKALEKRIDKIFNGVEFTPEQIESRDSLIAARMKEMSATNKQLEELISSEDRKARTAAMKVAREEGKKGQELAQAGFEAIGLSAEVQQKFIDLDQQRKKQMIELKNAITEILTPAQQETLAENSGGKGKRKPNAKKRKGKKGKGKQSGDTESADGDDQ